MPSPFPGMDPFLEDPAIFPDLHDSLVYGLRESINAVLPLPYYAGIGSRIWVEMSQRRIGPDINLLKPDGGVGRGGGVAVAEKSRTQSADAEPIIIRVPHDEIRETFVEIFAGPHRDRLVTSIEVLSWANKTPGEHGRDLYLKKQKDVLKSKVHLVEIDLLRGGTHTTAVSREQIVAEAGEFDYHVLVHEFHKLEEYYVYPRRLGMRLPTIRVPLLPEDGSVEVDLQPIVDRCYVTGHYERRIRYRDMIPIGPLSAEQRQWIEQVLKERLPN